MKRIFFVAALLLVQTAVFAQPGGGMGGRGGGMPGGGGMHGGGGGRPPMSMGGGQQNERLEKMATGVAEMMKKELKLDKKQYPKVKKAYTRFLTARAGNPENPEAGRKSLNKAMLKTLTAEQFENWKKLDTGKEGPGPGDGRGQRPDQGYGGPGGGQQGPPPGGGR